MFVDLLDMPVVGNPELGVSERVEFPPYILDLLKHCIYKIDGGRNKRTKPETRERELPRRSAADAVRVRGLEEAQRGHDCGPGGVSALLLGYDYSEGAWEGRKEGAFGVVVDQG